MASRRISIFINGREVANNIKAIRKEKRNVSRELNLMTRGTEEYNKKLKELQKLNGVLKEHSDSIRNVQSSWDKVKGQVGKFGAIAATALSVDAIVNYGREVAAVAKQMQKLRGETQQLTGLQGDSLDSATERVKAIADTFGKDVNEVLIAANNFSKQSDIEFSKSLELIEKGFLAGSDAGGDFLSKLEEYPVQLKAFGATAEDVIKLTAEETLGGFYDDKLLDTLKEANLSLKEMGKTQQEALAPLGNTFVDQLTKDIASGAITSEQAFMKIAKQAEEVGLNHKEVQTVIADVFKGAGEDAGGYEKVLTAVLSANSKSIDDYIDINNDLVRNQQALVEVNAQVAKAQNDISKEFGDSLNSVQLFGKQVQLVLLQGLIAFLRVGASVIETLKAIPKFLSENKVEIIGLGLAISGLNAKLIVSKTQMLASAAATTAKTVSDKAATIATNLMATAQKGLNFALRNNPIGLVITAIGVLAGAFAAAYKRSQIFRAGIAGLINVAREVGAIVGEVFQNFAGGFQSITQGNILSGLKQIGEGIKQANPVTAAFTQGKRLKEAFAEGFDEKVKLETEAEIEATIARGQQIIEQQRSANTQAITNTATSTTTNTNSNNTSTSSNNTSSSTNSTTSSSTTSSGSATSSSAADTDAEAKAIEQRLQQLNDFILQKEEELRLAQLDEGQQRIERKKAEYQEQIDLAANNEEQRKALTMLRDEEVATIEAELAAQRLEKTKEQELAKNTALKEINDAVNEQLKTEEELAILAVEEKYMKLLELARQQGLEVLAIEEAQQAALQEIEARYLNESLEANTAQKEKLNKLEEEAKSRRRAANDEILSSFQGAFSSIEKVLEKHQKKQEESGKVSEQQAAKTQKILDALFVAQKAIALAEIIINLQREISAISVNAAQLGPIAGPPVGIAQTAAAVIRAGTGAAAIAATTVQRFTQRKQGGYYNAIGEDDGRSYNARYVGQHQGGMLPSSPSLVLASEAGPEYYVPNPLMSNPVVIDHVAAIENIRLGKVTQRREGGFTNEGEGSTANTSTATNEELTLQLAQQSEALTMLTGVVKKLDRKLDKPVVAYYTLEEAVKARKSVDNLNSQTGGSLLS